MLVALLVCFCVRLIAYGSGWVRMELWLGWAVCECPFVSTLKLFYFVHLTRTVPWRCRASQNPLVFVCPDGLCNRKAHTFLLCVGKHWLGCGGGMQVWSEYAILCIQTCLTLVSLIPSLAPEGSPLSAGGKSRAPPGRTGCWLLVVS